MQKRKVSSVGHQSALRYRQCISSTLGAPVRTQPRRHLLSAQTGLGAARARCQTPAVRRRLRKQHDGSTAGGRVAAALFLIMPRRGRPATREASKGKQQRGKGCDHRLRAQDADSGRNVF
ncbi:hypothetical protein MTO96_001425 [Rhipicephalus appendiculatus]